MKTGTTIHDVAQEAARIAQSKADYLATTNKMVMLNGSELHVRIPNAPTEFGIMPLGHNQIAESLSIPRSYYDRLRSNYPDLLDQNVNRLFTAEPKNRMVRTLDGKVRAFLSDSYRRLDNWDVLKASLDVFSDIQGLEFASVQITDSRMYLKAVTPRISGEVQVGDVVQNGVVVSNSEVGLGSLVVQHFIYRLSCTNGMIGETLGSRRHAGSRLGAGDDGAQFYKEDTKRADDAAILLKVRDLIQAACSEAKFQAVLAKMRLATSSEPVQDTEGSVKALANTFSLTDDERKSVLNALIGGGDRGPLNKWRMLNAVTLASASQKSYDRATEMEEMGGVLLDMPDAEWHRIAVATK